MTSQIIFDFKKVKLSDIHPLSTLIQLMQQNHNTPKITEHPDDKSDNI